MHSREASHRDSFGHTEQKPIARRFQHVAAVVEALGQVGFAETARHDVTVSFTQIDDTSPEQAQLVRALKGLGADTVVLEHGVAEAGAEAPTPSHALRDELGAVDRARLAAGDAQDYVQVRSQQPRTSIALVPGC